MRGRLAIFVGLIAAAQAWAALAQTSPPQGEAPPAPKPVIRPNWEKIPQVDQFLHYYPERAMRLGISGKATIQCRVNKDGGVFDCQIVSEEPADAGFGAAAVKLSPYFKMKTRTPDGTPVDGGTVRIPIVFNIDNGPSSPPPDNHSGGASATQQADMCLNATGDAAIDACTFVIQSGLWSPSRLAFACERRGDLNLSLSRDELAIADFTQALSLDPRSFAAYNNRGNAYQLRAVRTQTVADVSLAIADYTRAISLRPDMSALYLSRARAYHREGGDAQGLPDAVKAVSLAPTNARALETRAEIYEKLGRRDEAIADYRAALKIAPDLKDATDGLKRLNAGN